MSPAANDDQNTPAGLTQAIDALHDPKPVTDFERARHARMVREQRARDEARRAREGRRAPDDAA